MRQLSLLLFVATMSIAAAAPVVQAETVNCTAITTLPYTITTPGVYCFTGTLQTGMISGNAITINANNVIIDMNGFTLSGLSAGTSTTANGFYSLHRRYITIKNGTVRGFSGGIFLLDDYPYTTSEGHVIEGVRADQNTFEGIRVESSGSLIQNNVVLFTGGTPYQSGNAHGIAMVGQENRVLNNDVSHTFATMGGTAIGIDLPISTSNLVVNNRISNADVGIDFAGSGKYRDNLTIVVTTPYSGGTDAGNNN